MRALIPLLFVTLAARGACVHPLQLAVGPRSIQTQCGYWKADVAAAGAHVAGAWMHSTVSGFTPNTVGATDGGILDAHGRLLQAEQVPLNAAPGIPSVATNGQLSLLAWSHTHYGTFAQFLDENGARIGEAIKVSTNGMSYTPPRALWTGSEWRVVFQNGTDVASVRVAPDGAISDGRVVAANATLAAARGNFIVVSQSGLFLLIGPASTQPLASIPSGAKVAIGDEWLAWAGGGIGALRLPNGAPVTIDATASAETIATAGDVVLWSDGTTTRGVRISGDGSTTPVASVAGRLYAAAATDEGVVMLISSECGSVASRFLPNGALAFTDSDTVSRATVSQNAHAIVSTPRGHHVVWSEPHPVEHGSRLYVTSFEGNAARPPLEIGRSGAATAAPLGDGSVVAFIEYTNGEAPARLKVARIDADGQLRETPREIASTWFIFEIAVAAEGERIEVFTLEHATYAWIGDVWRTTVAPDGTVTRQQLAANVDGWSLDAALTPQGIATSWYDAAGTQGLQLTVRDPQAMRTFFFTDPSPEPVLVGGTTPLILRRAADGVHAFFPRSGVDAIVGPTALVGVAPKLALQQSDGSFAVATVTNETSEAHIAIVNLTQTGVVTPREELCFDRNAWLLSMRGPTVDAVVTRDGGAVFLAKRPAPRRRAIR